MSAPRHGIEAVVAEAIAEAAPVEREPMLPLADADAVAAAMDAGLHGSTAVDQARRAGRPKGSMNKRTAQVRAWLLGKYAHPLEVLAQVYSRPVDVLAAELKCTAYEAQGMIVRAASEALPYFESKMPVAVGVSAEGQIQFVLAAPGGQQVIDGGQLTGLAALAMLDEQDQGVSEG